MTFVVDTNVLLVANGAHSDISLQCVASCVNRLMDIQSSGRIVIDDRYKIITEYLNKTRPNQPKGPGDIFLKWLLQNQSNANRVDVVTLTETADDTFVEFPDDHLAAAFDPPDRKFVAIACAHPDKPPILQATDCKWLNWWRRLLDYDVTVIFLCPDDVCRFYHNKFPNLACPPVPGN